MTPTLTQEQAFVALRTFLVAVLPPGTEVVQGQGNRVPMPANDNFVVMTPGRRQQMATTSHDYDPAASTEDIARSTALHFQLDVYGGASADNAQVITTLFRDAWGCSFLKPRDVAPLHCDDPRQMPLLAGEQQYIQRWTITAALGAIMSVTVPMEFADSLITTLDKGD
jgi:hypothetical protein